LCSEYRQRAPEQQMVDHMASPLLSSFASFD
jgi:hypothetical protein